MSDKRFALKAEEIKPLIHSQEGCIATDRITVDGCKVGFMYRENPCDLYPDSGWRFMAGDETQEYMDDPTNSEVYQLNTICNYDSDIIPFLEAETGKAFIRNEHGVFEEDTEFKSRE